MQRNLPKWTKSSRKECITFGELQKSLVEFFKKNFKGDPKKTANGPMVGLAETLTETNFSTRSYLMAIKEILEATSYSQFSKCLLEYSEKKIGPTEMLHGIYEAIVLKNNLMDKDIKIKLFRLFKFFLSEKYYDLHAEILNKCM